MFPKGPRFEPLKVPDVPGPNAYNIPQDSVLDNYKRGAFLEKTERFSKDKPSLQPEPSHKPTTTTTAKPTSNPSAAERYNLLQRKVDDLERVHLEGKKTHQAEMERCKQDAAASQKWAAEQADRFEKQKKQNAVLEARLQELKKSSTAEQGELKDLRHKLRLLELERDKVSSRQPELNELKKSLASLEAKRKDELKDRDRRIAELDRQLQLEHKMRESAESKVKDSKRSLEDEAHALKATHKDMEIRLHEAQSESRTAQARLADLAADAGHREADLLLRLEQHQHLLAAVAQQYGALANQSVPAAQHRTLELIHAALRLRQLRLERKVANAEAQVVELTHLFRQVKEDNSLLTHALHDALREITFYATPAADAAPPIVDERIQWALDDIGNSLAEDRVQRMQSASATHALTADVYRLQSAQLCFAASVIAKAHAHADALAEQRAADLASALASHEAIAARLEALRGERTEADEKLARAEAEAEGLRKTVGVLEARVAEGQRAVGDAAVRYANEGKRDRDAVQRLSAAVQRSRVAEEALRDEIEIMTCELADAEVYRDAYEKLNEEVTRLMVRNEIAEGEADRISRFNAEILGHHNPAQRIMYVDRIRQELAQAKHQIGLLVNEQENAAAQREALEHELDMYKSVQVPLESKPRTHITRVGRAPLVSLAASMNASVQRPRSVGAGGVGKGAAPVLEVIHDGDMTTDELGY